MQSAIKNIENIEISNLPKGVKISTMCASCKLGTLINIANIEKYLQLDEYNILTVKKSKENMRTLIPIVIKPQRNKKSKYRKEKKDTAKNNFYNQITVVVRIDDNKIEDLSDAFRINMKIFKNGSVQMSGCKSVRDINIALYKLIKKLSEIKAIIENGEIVEKQFIEDINKLSVYDFKIDMINSNYKVQIQIDRNKLYNLLQKKKIKSSYEPCIRACVIIKYVPLIDNPDNKEVSIFIFQKGNIIITGARSKNHISASYNYINDILVTHIDEIIKKEDEDLIMKYYHEVMKEQNIINDANKL